MLAGHPSLLACQDPNSKASLHPILVSSSAGGVQHNAAPVQHNTALVQHKTAVVQHNTASVQHITAHVQHNVFLNLNALPVPLLRQVY